MKRLLVPLLAALAACAPAPRDPDPKRDGAADLSVDARLEAGAQEGDIGRFLVTLRNASNEYLLLRDLVAEGGDATASWQMSLAGDIEFRKEPDYWIYSRKASGTPRPVFNRGLLAPGETLSFRTRIRLLELPRRFTLRYYRYDREEISRRVYFEKRYDREIRYVRLVGKDLEFALLPRVETDVASHRTVVFPYAEQLTTSPIEQPVLLQAAPKPRAFTLAQALAKIGASKAEEFTFWSELGLWAIRAGGKVRLVSESRDIEMPDVANLGGLFYLLDVSEHAKVEVEFLKETKSLFADAYRLAADSSGKRFFAFLPRNEILGFFGRVREYGLRLDVEVRADGGGRVLVTR